MHAAHWNTCKPHTLAAQHGEAKIWGQLTCEAENDCSSLPNDGGVSQRVLFSGRGSSHVQIFLLGTHHFCMWPQCAKLQPACEFRGPTLRNETSPQQVLASHAHHGGQSQVNRSCHRTYCVLLRTQKQLSLRPPWSGSQTAATSPQPPQLWPSVPKLPPAALLSHSSGRCSPGRCSIALMSTQERYLKLLASGQRTRPDPFVMHACTAHGKLCIDAWLVSTPQIRHRTRTCLGGTAFANTDAVPSSMDLLCSSVRCIQCIANEEGFHTSRCGKAVHSHMGLCSLC